MRGICSSEGILGFVEEFFRMLAKDLKDVGKFLAKDEGGFGFHSMRGREKDDKMGGSITVLDVYFRS